MDSDEINVTQSEGQRYTQVTRSDDLNHNTLEHYLDYLVDQFHNKNNKKRTLFDDDLRPFLNEELPERIDTKSCLISSSPLTNGRTVWIGQRGGAFYVNQNGNRVYLTPEQKRYKIRRNN